MATSVARCQSQARYKEHFQGHTLISEWGRVLGAIVFRQWRLWRHRQYRRLPRVDSEGMKVVEQSVV